jgi:hypothetical protein
MSLSFQKLEAVEVRDPRTILENQRYFGVLKCGQTTTLKAWTSTSVSNTSIQFSVPPPSPAIIVDRRMWLYFPVRLTFTGMASSGAPILQPGRDAPRAFPISGSIDTLQATINNQSVSINLADVIHAMSHYNLDVKLKNGDFSTTPNYSDQSQQYSDLFESTRNPLAFYADGIDETVMQRGGFSFTVVQNPIQNILPIAPVLLTAIVDVSFMEPIYLPPFVVGHNTKSGFFNVNSMDFNITLVGNPAYRMWSHDNNAGTNEILSGTMAFGGNIGGPQTQFEAGQVPLILATYITPQEQQILSPTMAISYDYYDVQRYPTTLATLPAGASTTVNSNNLQLASIPSRMFIYARRSNQELNNSCSFTDTFMSISNLSIQFMNQNGLLASANPLQLYEMSRKNGLNMSWTQWGGEPVYPAGVIPSGSAIVEPSIYGIGSIICVQFASDIGLSSLDCPGKLVNLQLQVTATVTNNSNTQMVTPSFYVVPILSGVFTIEGLGRASINVGVVTSQDILDAKQKPYLNYKDYENAQFGGDFFSSIKDFFSNHVLPALKGFVENRGISKTLGMVPHPYAQVGSKVARALGLGEGEGALIGGKQMSHNQLQRRLRNY